MSCCCSAAESVAGPWLRASFCAVMGTSAGVKGSKAAASFRSVYLVRTSAPLGDFRIFLHRGWGQGGRAP
eukprot:6185782-Pleurochrysis_carterae.AAC.2